MQAFPARSLTSEVAAALAAGSGGSACFDAALLPIERAFGAATVTLHRADGSEGLLHLVASRGLPPSLLPATREIPFGKGMAGLCASRREPVTVCNLQCDSSGTARPAARTTGVAGAIVVPVLGPDGALLGTLGVGKAAAHEYSAEELERLAECARLLGEKLSPAARR